MALTETQRERRRHHIGASDTPAILGLSPWRNPADVFYTKGQYETEDVTTDAMETGNRLEGPLLDFAAEKLGVKIDRRGAYRVSRGRDDGILAAHLDGPIVDKPEAVEAKYVGPAFAADWGMEGSDAIPSHVIVQCQHQMHVAELERVHVVAAVARYSLDWCLYVVERNDPLIDVIVDADVRFWHEYVLPGVCPPDVLPSLDTLKALVRVPDKVVRVPKQLVKDYDQAHAAQSFVQKQVKRADAALIAALGDAEAGDYGDKDKWVTCMRQTRAAHHVKESTFPVLRHDKRKGNA